MGDVSIYIIYAKKKKKKKLYYSNTTLFKKKQYHRIFNNMKSLYIILVTMKIVTKSLKYSSIICTVNSHYETREINCYFLKNKILTVK